MCGKGKSTTLHVIVQESPQQEFTFTSNPIRKVIGSQIELAAMVGVTTAGTYLQLNSNIFANLQDNPNSTDETLARSPIAWFQAYPLPLLSNQLSPIEFEYSVQKDVQTFQLWLQSDGVITYAPGWYAIWRVLFFHPLEARADPMPKPMVPCYEGVDGKMECGDWD